MEVIGDDKVPAGKAEILISSSPSLLPETLITESTTLLLNPYNQKTLVPFFIHNQLKRHDAPFSLKRERVAFQFLQT